MPQVPIWIDLTYLLSAVCFILGIKFLNAPKRARLGNQVAAFGMTAAVVATIFHPRIETYAWIGAALGAGAAVGWISARRVQMTAMPQMVALFNGVGGGAVALVAIMEFASAVEASALHTVTGVLSAIIGGVSFSGNLVAFAKLQELMTGRPIFLPGQKLINLGLLMATGAIAVQIAVGIGNLPLFLWLTGAALAMGVTFVLPVGGADMPVVISLLNSFTGLAAGLAGFMLENNALLIGGALVGASGLILTLQMCAAMNRSLENVFFGALGAGPAAEQAKAVERAVRSYGAEDVALMLANANKVIVIPGYGMATAQAQHAVKELANKLAKRGVVVKYAIHPVAGRMPGHMNVLLAEAGTPYEQLADLEEINPEFPETDVALVIGANDVVNPAARHDQSSPLYGMPILDADKARACVICKRGMGTGYAGVDNELYYAPNTIMLFGDAKASITALASAIDDY
ncbi:MAG: NAD(P)(+) transhydrogenase (Re/Si-specific) subunit beta [Armatimonadetes bacterium]|nr:NAD(P)(+) transhydrogenase (Re/Si-specific) subunit beta [Armatimonadota bacterium]